LEAKRTYNGKSWYIIFVFSNIVIIAHTGRVTALKFDAENSWLISASRDKSFAWYCTSTGHLRGSFKTESWCTAVEYPFA